MTQAATHDLPQSLTGLSDGAWHQLMADLGGRYGVFNPLGKRHSSMLIEAGQTLLVTFESIESVRTLCPQARPVGWQMVEGYGWSHLAVFSDGETWFRDPAIHAALDRLVDDGFYDDYDQVIFFGVGPGGYAASAYSVSAPGARVLALRPQATLDARRAGWDRRFPEMRRTSFNGRYGYAPFLSEAAERLVLIYDPSRPLDAMHASLFTGGNVMPLALRNLDVPVEMHLYRIGAIPELLVMAAAPDATLAEMAGLARRRRDHPAYLAYRRDQLLARGQTCRARLLAANVARRLDLQGFDLDAAAAHGFGTAGQAPDRAPGHRGRI